MKVRALAMLLMFLWCASCTRPPQNKNSITPQAQQLAGEGAAAFNATNYSKAQTLSLAATRIDPQFAEAWVGYGMASVRLGQSDQARQGYERALSIYQARHRQNPSDVNQLVQQIFLMALLDRPDEAEKMLRQAHVDFPKDQTLAKLAENFNESARWWSNLMVKAK